MYILYDHDNTVCAWVVYQVVGFFDVAARLCASDKPIAAVAPPEGGSFAPMGGRPKIM